MPRKETGTAAPTSSVIPVQHDVFNVVKEGNLAVLDRMIQKENLNVNLTRWSGFTLLHRAATEGQTDVCDMLIAAGARVNQRSVWGWYTPLHLALANGYEDTAKFLIESGANIRAKSKSKEDCCDYAQRRGFKELAAQFRLRMQRLEMQQIAAQKRLRAENNAALIKEALEIGSRPNSRQRSQSPSSGTAAAEAGIL